MQIFPQEILAWNVKPIIWENKKIITNLSSAEFPQRVLKVKQSLRIDRK